MENAVANILLNIQLNCQGTWGSSPAPGDRTTSPVSSTVSYQPVLPPISPRTVSPVSYRPTSFSPPTTPSTVSPVSYPTVYSPISQRTVSPVSYPSVPPTTTPWTVRAMFLREMHPAATTVMLRRLVNGATTSPPSTFQGTPGAPTLGSTPFLSIPSRATTPGVPTLQSTSRRSTTTSGVGAGPSTTRRPSVFNGTTPGAPTLGTTPSLPSYPSTPGVAHIQYLTSPGQGPRVAAGLFVRFSASQ